MRMRNVLALVWAVIIFAVVLVVANFCAMIGFPAGSTSGTILRVAGGIVGLGLGIDAYRRSAKRPGA